MAKKFYIIDGHSLVHRSFYALPPLSAQGKPMGAVFGFARIILKLLREERPDFFAVAFDTPAPTFRHSKFLDYKAHRKKTPEELSVQFADIYKLLAALGVPTYSIDGFEADDILGTMAAAMAAKGHRSIIITGDKDALQLVDDAVTVRYTRKGISDVVEYNPSKIEKDYGLLPEQLIDVKALMGDPSDNIPGVPGIGEKTAIKLIREYGSLERVMANLDNLGTRAHNSLRDNRDLAYLSKDLARIRLSVPLEFAEEQLAWQEPDWEKVADLFRRWQFTSLLADLPHQGSSEEKKTDFCLISTDLQWEEFKEEFRPGNIFPLSMRFEGKRPREYIPVALGIAGKDKIYVIELATLSIGEVMAFLAPYLCDPSLPKVGHNLKPFLEVCLDYKIEIKGLHFDTFLAAYIMDPAATTPSHVQLLQRLRGGVLPPEDSNQFLALAVEDLPALAEDMAKSLQKIGATDILQAIELPLLPILARMEYNGIKIDKDYLNNLTAELEKKLTAIAADIFSYTAEPFNINSPKQLGEVLFEELKLPVIRRTKTGYATGAEVLEKLANSHPIIKHILAHRQLAKLKSTYSEALPPLVNKGTQRLHTTFNQTVTATGRLSSADPNLQNIPIRTPEGQKIRKAFVAEEGNILISADYSQIELRVLAHITGDSGLVESFQRGEDIHARTAAEVFAVDVDEVTNELRQRAKAINFGIAYGMSPFGLAQELGLPQEIAKSYIDRYFSRYTEIKKYIDGCIDKARQDGYVTTIFNRRRYLPDINHRISYRRGFAERMAINTPIQGTAADLMKLAMIKVADKIRQVPEAQMLLQVHDELIFEVPRDLASRAIDIIRQEMENAYELTVPLVVDVRMGTDWLAMN